MHWRFDPLFSIAVYHRKYETADPDTGETPRKAPEFVLEPSRSSAARMAAMGWVFKARTGSCTIYGEKKFQPNGTAVLRAKPGSDEGLTFLLRLPNAAILQETYPYISNGAPNTGLPAFSGRSRLLYFDNLNPTPGTGTSLWLTPGPVDVDQFGSKAPVPFDFVHPNPNAGTIAFTELSPSGAAHTITLNKQTHGAVVALPENGYRLAPMPGNYSTIVFLSPENVKTDVLGVVRIFEPPGGWEPLHPYQILFDQA